MTRVKWKLTSVLSEIVLILTENRCTVCVERTIGSQIILDAPGALFAPNVPSAQKSFWTHPIVPQVDEAQVEGRFGPFGHSANHDAR